MAMLEILVLFVLAATLGLYAAHELAPTRWAVMVRTLRDLAGAVSRPRAAGAEPSGVAGPDVSPRVAATGVPSGQPLPVPLHESEMARMASPQAPPGVARAAGWLAALWEARACWAG